MDQSLHLKTSSLLVVLVFCCFVASRQCDNGYFWDSATSNCQVCAVCSWNQVTEKPCIHNRDTVCDPFKELSSFSSNQIEIKDSPPLSYEYDESLNEDYGSRGDAGNYGNKVFDFPWQDGFRWKEGSIGISDSQRDEPIVEKDDGEYWKNLAFALIGVVCILIFVATVVVFMACRRMNRTVVVKRSEDEDDDDSGYVVIRAIRPPPMVSPPQLPATYTQPSALTTLLPVDEKNVREVIFPRLKQRQELRRKGTYRPKRRLLNYDADDVFESEDSAGSRSSRLGPLHPIPERSVSAENASEQECETMPDECCSTPDPVAVGCTITSDPVAVGCTITSDLVPLGEKCV